MKKLLLFFLLFSVGRIYAQNPVLNLIPQPADIKQSGGQYELLRTSTISFDAPEALKIAGLFSQKLNLPTGFTIKPQQGNTGSIQFNLNKVPVSTLGKEGYTLVSSPDGVVITANDPAGLFYGMQTLLQLLPKEIEGKTAANIAWTIPSVKITDYPRFAWRGLMLDVSRNFFTKEEVEKYIDQMARYKYNTFHWHLTDDNGWRIEIKSLPKLTEVGAWRVPRFGRFGERAEPKEGEAATVGGFYTQSDIKEIIKFAQDRFVTILPEIDVPGHSMAAIASYPELSCTKDPNTKVNPGSSFSEWFNDGTFKMRIDNTLNPSDEKVYEFLDKVFTEMAAIFPNPYIHVGGDECYKGFWTKDAGCQALMKKMNMTKPEELQAYFMKRVETILKSKGKKLIGWDEILEGGVAPEATVMSWRGIKGGIEAAKMGHFVVMTPTTFGYLDYQQGEETIEPPIYAGLRLNKCYSFNPVPEGVDAKYILGGQGNLWTEQVETLHHAEYMTWPRAWALAEDFWSPNASKNWDNFIQRVEKQFDRSALEGVNYSTAIYDAIINVKKSEGKISVEMASEVPGLDIYYTIDGAMPGIYSPKYTNTVSIPEGPVTLRVVTCRNGKQIGHLITLNPEELKKRAGGK
ncbi:MAG TPA: family 20 glycosylhydrolase [Bacteroidales bacterium]|nr:family 20 glycosylhydrolase [Bacteroidales bacterium]